MWGGGGGRVCVCVCVEGGSINTRNSAFNI